jgi:hypothetical protein
VQFFIFRFQVDRAESIASEMRSNVALPSYQLATLLRSLLGPDFVKVVCTELGRIERSARRQRSCKTRSDKSPRPRHSPSSGPGLPPLNLHDAESGVGIVVDDQDQTGWQIGERAEVRNGLGGHGKTTFHFDPYVVGHPTEACPQLV